LIEKPSDELYLGQQLLTNRVWKAETCHTKFIDFWAHLGRKVTASQESQEGPWLDCDGCCGQNQIQHSQHVVWSET